MQTRETLDTDRLVADAEPPSAVLVAAGGIDPIDDARTVADRFETALRNSRRRRDGVSGITIFEIKVR